MSCRFIPFVWSVLLANRTSCYLPVQLIFFFFLGQLSVCWDGCYSSGQPLYVLEGGFPLSCRWAHLPPDWEKPQTRLQTSPSIAWSAGLTLSWQFKRESTSGCCAILHYCQGAWHAAWQQFYSSTFAIAVFDAAWDSLSLTFTWRFDVSKRAFKFVKKRRCTSHKVLSSMEASLLEWSSCPCKWLQ